jgi:hypothetical protein
MKEGIANHDIIHSRTGIWSSSFSLWNRTSEFRVDDDTDSNNYVVGVSRRLIWPITAAAPPERLARSTHTPVV